jgi:hypothetical protein
MFENITLMYPLLPLLSASRIESSLFSMDVIDVNTSHAIANCCGVDVKRERATVG